MLGNTLIEGGRTQRSLTSAAFLSPRPLRRGFILYLYTDLPAPTRLSAMRRPDSA